MVRLELQPEVQQPSIDQESSIENGGLDFMKAINDIKRMRNIGTDQARTSPAHKASSPDNKGTFYAQAKSSQVSFDNNYLLKDKAG